MIHINSLLVISRRALLGLALIAPSLSAADMAAESAPASAMKEEVAAQDKSFAMQAAARGLTEVAAAELALQKTIDPTVKNFATHMIQDHSTANQELMKIAEQKDITLPTQPDEKHQQAMEELKQLSGTEFDAMYMQQAGLKDHMAMEQLLQQQIATGQDTELKAFAQKTLPTVQAHLMMAKEKVAGSKANDEVATSSAGL